MGVTYNLRPLADELPMGWLRQLPLVLPSAIPPGRFPSYEEVAETLLTETPWHVELSRYPSGAGWHAWVERGKRLAILEADERFQGSRPGEPAFYFVRGWPPLVVEIRERLARVCGPFVVWSPESDLIALVQPGADPNQEWVSIIPPEEERQP